MLKEISIQEEELWDSIVKKFKNYDVFYLNAYARTFQSQGEGEPVLFYYEDSEVKMMQVAMKRDIAELPIFKGEIKGEALYDLVTPYGYGGFWAEGSITKKAVREYGRHCIQKGYVCEFVRFELFSNYHEMYEGNIESRSHNIIRTLDISLDSMMMDFEHKVRKNIRKAERSGLEFYVDEDGEYLEDFLNIYYDTMKRTNAMENFYFERDFFDILNMLGRHKAFFHVLFEKKVISTELVVYGKENAYSFLGGTNSDYFDLRPNDFLKFGIITWAKEKGLKNFVLGGGYGEDDGIFRYKKAFAPKGITKFYIGKRIFDQKNYDKLVEIRERKGLLDKTSEYFPLYRA